jgi:hypothetical protein
LPLPAVPLPPAPLPLPPTPAALLTAAPPLPPAPLVAATLLLPPPPPLLLLVVPTTPLQLVGWVERWLPQSVGEAQSGSGRLPGAPLPPQSPGLG